jgi:DNA-binding response OmpR family regulator
MQDKTKILIVEDELLAAKLMQRNLALLGYLVCEPVATGRAAIEAAALERPDLALVDIRLDGAMDGVEAAQEMIARHAIPVVFLSGYLDERTLERVREMEPAICLRKPAGVQEIATAINAALQDAGK